MDKHIYKYCADSVFGPMFARDRKCGIKCSYPKNYNDPFELFLGADTACTPDELAVYREIIQNLPQLPTTCFSNAPTVAPMWAHYALNHHGFALEFSSDAIASTIESAKIEDVVYREEPDPDIKMNVARAAVTKKARHAVWLRQAALYHAYFSKFTSWSYEEECRLVVSDGEIEEISNHMILFLPLHCVTAIILGMNASDELISSTRDFAFENGIQWLREIVGKSNPRSYFMDEKKRIWLHDGKKLVLAENVCGKCSEPIAVEFELCPWCQISSQDEFEAAAGNPLRLMHKLGMLDDYMRGIDAIERGRDRE